MPSHAPRPTTALAGGPDPASQNNSDPAAARFALDYLERSPDLHLIVGLGWGVEWVAGAWEQTVGWTREQLLGMSLEQILHPAETGPVLTALQSADGSPHEFLGRVRCATGGDYRWLAFNGRVGPGGVRIFISARDVSERVRHEAEQSQQLTSAAFAATHDPLTGLGNRALLTEHLTRAIARSARSGEPPLVLFADLDDFKRINDELGHERGDTALREIAGRLAVAFRPSDLVARHGGDEFVVVIEDGDATSARARIERAVAEPLRLDGRDYRVSASVGAAHGTSPETSPSALIAAADRDMYERKRLASSLAAAGNGNRPASGNGERR